MIQEALRTQLEPIVDVPKPAFGNTNDTNIGRQFVIDYELLVTILGTKSGLILDK